MVLDTHIETNINLALLDPPRWGWSAGGKVVDLMTPQEVSFVFCFEYEMKEECSFISPGCCTFTWSVLLVVYGVVLTRLYVTAVV
jgi:hypothetical protein